MELVNVETLHSNAIMCFCKFSYSALFGKFWVPSAMRFLCVRRPLRRSAKANDIGGLRLAQKDLDARSHLGIDRPIRSVFAFLISVGFRNKALAISCI